MNSQPQISAAALLLGSVAIAALILPGWILARARGLRHPSIVGFITGSLALHGFVLVLTFLRLPLTAGVCTAVWLTLIAICAWVGRKAFNRGEWRTTTRWNVTREQALGFAAAVPAVGSAIYRATAHPLFGIDTNGRWGYLAELMIARASLDYYPPVTTADYTIYAWPDAIAPLVSSLYFWAYAIGGEVNPVLTTPTVIAQLGLLTIAIHALARRWFSEGAPTFAVTLMACSPLLLWATMMGQESGVMTIAVIAMLLYLPTQSEKARIDLAVIAGLAAGLGALAREYGTSLPVAGLAICLARKLPFKTCVSFALAAVLTAIPWYLRSWVRTGNPLFGFPGGAWFPNNSIYSLFVETQRGLLAWSNAPPDEIVRLVANAVVVLALGSIGASLFFRRARAAVGIVLLVTIWWILSVPYTAAGFTYASRVLAPALALATVLGGAACARLASTPRSRAMVLAGLWIVSLDTSIRLLGLPSDTYRLPPATWLSVGNTIHKFHNRPVYREIAAITEGERVLTLGPNALLNRHGARTLPFWSPEVLHLFDASSSAEQNAQRLRAAGIGFILLGNSPLHSDFVARVPFISNPRGLLQFAGETQDLLLLRVRLPTEQSPPSVER